MKTPQNFNCSNLMWFVSVPVAVMEGSGPIDCIKRSSTLTQGHKGTIFIALLAVGAPAGSIVEIGASAGYSTLWLALAAKSSNRRVTAFEILPEKVELARETFRLAGVDHIIELIAGDARRHSESVNDIAFCFLDAEKEIYGEIYEMVIPRLVKGGLLVADNAVNHREALRTMLDRALSDERVDALIVPVGKGELVCRKI